MFCQRHGHARSAARPRANLKKLYKHERDTLQPDQLLIIVGCPDAGKMEVYMKVKIDPELCIGCGLCVDTCAAVFKMEGDKAVVCAPSVPKEQEELCKKATDECPVTAIIIE